jgi:hypothetical protein
MYPVYTSCQEKVTKKKARPLRRPAAPGALRCSGATGAAELAPVGLRQSSPFFPLRPALLDDAEGKNQPIAVSTVDDGIQTVLVFPVWSAEQRRHDGGSRRGLFEGRSPEFRSRPA